MTIPIKRNPIKRNPYLDQLLWDIFVTCMEGGMMECWCEIQQYHIWTTTDEVGVEDQRGFYAVICGEDDDMYRIDRTTVAHGLRLAATEWRDKIVWQCGDKPPLFVGPDTEFDHDAIDAFNIVQLGLFGDVVYG